MIKTAEVIIFGSNSVTSSVHMGLLAQNAKPVVKNLEIKVDAKLKFDSKTKTSFSF